MKKQIEYRYHTFVSTTCDIHSNLENKDLNNNMYSLSVFVLPQTRRFIKKKTKKKEWS